MACGCGGWNDAFSVAVAEGDEETARLLLASDLRLVKRPVARARQTAWHVAAASGHVAILKLLVETVRAAAEPHLKQLGGTSLKRLVNRSTLTPDDVLHRYIHLESSVGFSPLILAAREGKQEAVAYLLSLGADPWQHDRVGMTALHHAAQKGYVPIIEDLLANPTPPSSMACSVNQASAKYVDCMDFSGWAPMHYAVYRCHVEAATALVLCDANIIARSLIYHHAFSSLPPGCAPLHIAASLGNLPMIQLILRAYYESSADLVPNMLATNERRRRQRSQPDPRLILTRTGRLAFHVALRFGQHEVLEWLDPSIPLMFLLSGSDDNASAGQQGGQRGGSMATLVTVPRLTVLAAKALHARLVSSLEDVERQVQEKQKLLEQQKKAAEGKALLAKQAARFKQMIKRVVKGGRGSKTGEGSDKATDAAHADARSASPGPDPMLATMPALGGASSQQATRPSSRVAVRPRPKAPQRRLIVQASARYDRGGTSAVRASQSRLVQLLASGINFESSSEFDSQNQRMGIAIPQNLEDDPVAVFTRSAANTTSGQQQLTAIPMRTSPAAAALHAPLHEPTGSESPTFSRPAEPGADLRSPGTPHSQLDTPRLRHSDPGDVQTLRAAIAGETPAGNVTVAVAVAAAAAASSSCSSPSATKLGRVGSLRASLNDRSSRGVAGSSGGSPAVAHGHTLMAMGAGGGDTPRSHGDEWGSGGGNFQKVSIGAQVAATGPSRVVSIGASGLSCSVRHSEPGSAHEFSFSVVPVDEPPTPEGEEADGGRASMGDGQTHADADAPPAAVAGSGGGAGAGVSSAGVDADAPNSAATAVAVTAAGGDHPAGKRLPPLRPSKGALPGVADSSSSLVQQADTAKHAAKHEHEGDGAEAGLGVTASAADQPCTSGEAAGASADHRAAAGPSDGKVEAGPDACRSPDPRHAGPLPTTEVESPCCQDSSPGALDKPFVDLPGVVESGANELHPHGDGTDQGIGTSFLTADERPHHLSAVMEDAEQEDRLARERSSKLSARGSKGGASGAVTVLDALPAPAFPDAPQGAASVDPDRDASDAQGCGAGMAPNAMQQDVRCSPGGHAGAEPSEGAHGDKDGLGGLLSSIRKHIKKMSAQVVPLGRSQTRGRHTPPTAFERRAKSFSSSLAVHGMETDDDAASVTDEAVAGGADVKAEPEAEDESEDDVCPVCLDEAPNVIVGKCRHKLCLGCAKDLCNRYNLTPALCPYCRTIISGFTLA